MSIAATTTPVAAPRIDSARALLLLTLLLTALAYIGTLRFQFVSDDLVFIVNNPVLHSWKHVPHFFVQHVWQARQSPGQAGDYYRPIYMLWMVVNHSLFGLKPMGWHALNVALHLLVTWLVYRVGLRVTRDRMAAAIAALIFGLHPAHIESVAWVCGSTDPLMSVFVLGSMLAYLRARENGVRGGLWLAAAVFSYALALLTKETALLLPAVLLAYEWMQREASWLKAALWRLLPFGAVAVMYLAVRYVVLRGLVHPEPQSLGMVLLTLPAVLWFYLRHLLWPFGLSLFYDLPFVSQPGIANFVLPLALFVAAVVALAWILRRWRIAAFAAVWIVVFILPALVGLRVFVGDDLAHDRYLYLPVAGVAFVAGVAVSRLKIGNRELFGQPAAQVGVIAALALVLGWGTAAQSAVWASDLTLYAHGAKVAPRNPLALDHLANELYKRGRPAAALELYQQALAVSPHHWWTQFSLGITQFGLGNYQEAERELTAASQIRDDNPNEFYFLGLARMQLGRLPEAETALRRAIALFPGAPGYHLALGTALERQGKLAEARAAYRAELALGPNPVAQQRLANLPGH